MDFLCLYLSKGVPASGHRGAALPQWFFGQNALDSGNTIFEKTLQKDFNFSDDYLAESEMI